MKVQLSIVLLALLQFGMPTGAANENQGNLRGGDIENQDLDPEETGRELYGYPFARPRPGQARTRYNANSLLGFRPYTNSDPLTSSVQQGGLPAATAPQPQGGFTGGASANPGRFVRPINKRAPVPGTIPKRSDGSFDGNFVVGVPRTGSLSQALGFYKVDAGSQVFFVQDENDDAVVVANTAAAAAIAMIETDPPEPTVSPAPTLPVTPSPTATPTINPTRVPTENPTKEPTPNPTLSPTRRPTRDPTRRPTRSPTTRPSRNPTRRPTPTPTA
eukprot:CAMPEP_0116149820 /NCGR_PEP_ID=MMETSP0329-20121206/19185_1 /TAXON_ID=697910 /ORGANISM="Pseudo-nitzschia arenysensis, Strain B593" /LENGTH=273 /DNA_ID=CAMNT_0003646227 /DNA_START=313 /DNA_END=1134 /DNA_ORIENTATION=+